jgi:alpha-aminoadipic semialdehyde synthase
VIGDISCDIEGSVECTVKPTQPDNPVYVYDPHAREATDGVAGNGPVVMAVDNLPCELPRDATQSFGTALVDLVAEGARADYAARLEDLALPGPLKRAVIVHRGALAPTYRYLEQHAIRGAAPGEEDAASEAERSCE